MNPDSVKELIQAAVAFRDQRDWAQFHYPKELAISLSIESAELLHLMQWHKGPELDLVIIEKREHLQDELADVLFSVLLLADELKIDLGGAFLEKLKKTGQKYPVEKARGSAKKYTEF
jgi:NTP pyrophosphatase (non-canonical NTP hydrolase)